MIDGGKVCLIFGLGTVGGLLGAYLGMMLGGPMLIVPPLLAAAWVWTIKSYFWQ